MPSLKLLMLHTHQEQESVIGSKVDLSAIEVCGGEIAFFQMSSIKGYLYGLSVQALSVECSTYPYGNHATWWNDLVWKVSSRSNLKTQDADSRQRHSLICMRTRISEPQRLPNKIPPPGGVIAQLVETVRV